MVNAPTSMVLNLLLVVFSFVLEGIDRSTMSWRSFFRTLTEDQAIRFMICSPVVFSKILLVVLSLPSPASSFDAAAGCHLLPQT
jgi:hypothetical protein